MKIVGWGLDVGVAVVGPDVSFLATVAGTSYEFELCAGSQS